MCLGLSVEFLEFGLQLGVQFPHEEGLVLGGEGDVAGVVEHADVVGLEVIGLKVQEHEGQASLRLHRELLVQLVEDGLDRQHNVHRLTVEKVVQILLSQHNLGT